MVQVRTTEAELAAGIVMQDPLMFAAFFWQDDLTIPKERTDLGELAGKQIISKEQKMMYLDESQRILFCTGRKLAKSLCIEAKIIQWSVMNKRAGDSIMGHDEALVFAPSEGHLKPIQSRVWARISSVKIFKEMVLAASRGNKPELMWSTGIKVFFRVEGMSGTDTNMAGIRAKWVLGDEMAFGDQQNHASRLQTALPNARWLYAGVPNGVRTSPFYELDQTTLGSSWSRHKYTTYINPLYWSDQAKAELIRSYGTESNPGYITQVLGQWAEQMVSSFPPSMIATHTGLFYTQEIGPGAAKRMIESGRIGDFINVPTVRCERFVIGNDHGFAPDPSVYIIAIQQNDPAKGINDVLSKTWRYYARLTFRTVTMPEQSKIIIHFINNFFPGATFVGMGTDERKVVHDLHDRSPILRSRIFWTPPGGDQVETDDFGLPKLDDNGHIIKVGNKQFWTEKLKDAMAFYNSGLPPSPFYLLLGQDDQVINELVSTTETKRESGYTTYHGIKLGGHRQLDNNTDALRYLVATIMLGTELDTSNTAELGLLRALGWIGSSGGDEGKPWTPPWSH